MSKYKTIKGLGNGLRAALKNCGFEIAKSNKFRYTEGVIIENSYDRIYVSVLGKGPDVLKIFDTLINDYGFSEGFTFRTKERDNDFVVILTLDN